MKTQSAGQLRERVRFSKRTVDIDQYGNEEGAWTAGPPFTVAARIMSLRGSEPVLAQRLQGVQPVIITIRKSSQTAALGTEWRAVDTRAGTIYNIITVTPAELKDHLDLVAHAGVAI
jgi:head-tail adaptor